MYITIDDNDKFAVDLEKVSPKVKDSFMRFLSDLRKYESNKSCTLYKPCCGDTYYTIVYDNDDVFEATWIDSNMDLNNYKFNKVFKTEDEAKFELERNRIIQKLRYYAMKYNKLLDWENFKECKYFICYEHVNKRIDLRYSNFNEGCNTIYFSSKEIALNAIKEVGEENIKKYIFRINEDNKNDNQ